MDNTFTFERFKTENIAVACGTQEEYNEFMQLCENEGIKWSNGRSATHLKLWGVQDITQNITIENTDVGLVYSCRGGHQEAGYQIIEAADILKQSENNIHIPCTDCENHKICKYENDMKTVALKGQWMSELPSIITVELKCASFRACPGTITDEPITVNNGQNFSLRLWLEREDLVAVHCTTRKEYDAFMQLCENEGLKWRGGVRATDYDAFSRYKSKTTIADHCGVLSCCSRNYYEMDGYTILEASDIIEQFS